MSAGSSALLTDLYQLTMLQAYFEAGMGATAVFEFFVRKLPPQRGFLIAAGLEQALEYLEDLRLTAEELQWLADSGRFSKAFVDQMESFRFTGDVHAMPEGTVFFANEPMVRVAAPIPEAQFVESRLINLLHLQTLIASKAARSVLAAPGKLLVDFGMRRAHGAEAGLLAARASYIAGFSGSATVLAAVRFGIPVYGTMAHSFIQAHESESVAFEQFALSQPDNVVLLIDTYDTEAAAQKVVAIAPRLKDKGVTIRAVRLDSGDLAAHARKVRAILDAGGLRGVGIFSSGNLDEQRLCHLLDAEAPIDGFGVGTHLDVSSDAPFLDCVYKLQEYADRPRRKRSEGKATWPGRKQVHRQYHADGSMKQDVLTLEDDPQEGAALLHPVMKSGKRLQPPVPLDKMRAHAAAELHRLPAHLRRLDTDPPYSVVIAQSVRELADRVDQQYR